MQIISSIGWPSSDIVGLDGEQSAWLIIQNSDDINVQENCLVIKYFLK